MFVSTLLCFLRDCMKGDETENKKIGCTVNLMVKMFPLSLCDTVKSCSWDGKGWGRNLCQAMQLQNPSTGNTEKNDEDWEDPLEVSGSTRCLKQGQIGQAPQGCVQLRSVYPCDTGSTTSLTSSFRF